MNAVDQLAELAADRDLTPEELVGAGGELTERIDQPLRAAVSGVTPFYARIDAVADLTSADDVNAYVRTRRAALDALVRTDGTAPITVSLGFSERPTLSAVLDLVRLHHGRVEQVLLDATVRGQRLFTQVLARDAATVLTASTNEQVARQLVQTLEEMDQPLCGAAPQSIEWHVRATRVNLLVSDAAALATEKSVLLVDPLNDMTDDYRTRVAEVNVGAWPNVTIASEESAGKVAPDAICQEDS